VAMGDWLPASIPEVRRCPQMTGNGAKFGRKQEETFARALGLTARELSSSCRRWSQAGERGWVESALHRREGKT
jgi:hypothetical protein